MTIKRGAVASGGPAVQIKESRGFSWTFTDHNSKQSVSIRENPWPVLSCHLLGLRHDPHIRLGRLPAAGIFLLPPLRSMTAGADDHVLARLPVHRRRHLVLGRELDRIEHAQHFVEVASRAHGIAEHQLDFLVRPHHEHRAHGGVVSRRCGLRRCCPLSAGSMS